MRNDPREITVKYPAVCAETGKQLAKGDRAIYYPADRKLYSEESKQAAEYRGMRFAQTWGMGDASW